MIRLLDAIEQFGWAVVPSCLNADDSGRLRQECSDAYNGGAFQRAGVGRGVELAVRGDIRQDHIMWLLESSIEQNAYLLRLEVLRLALNARFFLGLFSFEGHFAVYAEGAFYKPHLDRHAASNQRVVTIILYLNANWQPGDGGELKLWTSAGQKSGDFVLIEPRMGTLVCFLAGDFWHEVLPAIKPRMSITGWFRCR